MSQPLLPISSSTPSSSHFAPSESRWGTRTVVLVLGAGAIGLAFYLYRRFAVEPRPESTTPLASRSASLDSTRVSFIDRQHSSEMTHNGNPCLNETHELRFDHFAEGFFKINLDEIFPGFQIPESENAIITVRCSHEDREFFVYKEKISTLSTIAFFMPNMPYRQMTVLTINYADPQKNTYKSFDVLVESARGFYKISDADCLFSPLSNQTVTHTELLHRPRPIATPFQLLFSQGQVITRDEILHETILMKVSQSITALAYLKIVHQDPEDSEKEIAIALPFYFYESQKKELLPSTLIELWRDAYHQATGQDAPTDLNLKLVEVKLITYIEEDSYDFSGEGSDSD